MAARVIKIARVGKSTIVDILEDGGSVITETIVFNKSTNIALRNNCLTICTECGIKLFIRYDDLFDKLASTDLRDYISKAAALFLFSNEG